VSEGSGADGEGMVVPLDGLALQRLRIHAAAVGVPAGELASRWILQRLEVEDATRRAQGGGVEQLLRLVQAIEDIEPPEDG
jgi:hypothetical protein